MKLLIGLGNPGEKYKNNRHNVGFMVVNRMAKGKRWIKSKSTGALIVWVKVNGEEVELIKPQKFMNKSGVTIKGVMKKHPKVKLKDIYVIHDDLDIPLGKYKISKKGPRDHRGLNNIYEQVGKDFWHVRMGIDGEREGKTGEEYVLTSFRPGEREVLERTIESVLKELEHVLG